MLHKLIPIIKQNKQNKLSHKNSIQSLSAVLNNYSPQIYIFKWRFSNNEMLNDIIKNLGKSFVKMEKNKQRRFAYSNIVMIKQFSISDGSLKAVFF